VERHWTGPLVKMPFGWLLGVSSVQSRVVLSGFIRVMLRLDMMAVREMSVMTRPLMFAGFVVFRCGKVVLRSLLVVFCCEAMVFCAFLRHGVLLE